MKQITLKNMNMSIADFHRACQTGLALRITRLLKLPKQDFDSMPIEEIEKFVSEYGSKL
jgi:hypothetical protein